MEHAEGLLPGFTAKYHVKRLGYFRTFGEIEAAVAREKQLKGWRRAKKTKLIESLNPSWNDLGGGEAERKDGPGSFDSRNARSG